MNVLLNLIHAGSTAYGSKARTGIFRVVEQLARGLASSPECQVSFHATENLWQTFKYFEENLRTPRTRFVLAPWQMAAARHLSPLERFVGTTLRNRALPMRLLRYASTRYVRLADPLFSRLDDRVLRQMDIYHSPFDAIAAKIKRHRHLRRFTTVYDLIALSHPEFFNAGVARLLRATADGFDAEDYVLCISEATRAVLLDTAPALDPARVFVTPLAAGPAFYPERDSERLTAVRARVGLPPDAPYFLSVCTLEPRKNLDSVIRAFARLKRDAQVDRETRLVLVGNVGWKTEGIFGAIEEARECRESILLTGFVPDEDLAALYSGALAFVYMSWQEGFGLPPLEAMQCGVAVLCSNTSSLPEVVGDAGVLVPPADLDGIASAMRMLALDEIRRGELAARAIARAGLFSWERFTRQTLEAYRTALAARG